MSSDITFGTSGARGLVEAFDEVSCAYYVKRFITLASGESDFSLVAVGCDLRPSSPRIKKICSDVMRSLGFDVLDYGVLPTPAVAFNAMKGGIPAVVITGSHIPFDRNGMKFYLPRGEISKQDEVAIQTLAYLYKAASPLGALKPCFDAAKNYASRYIEWFGAKALNGVRVGLYQHSAAGRDINIDVLESLGADVVALGRSDEFVPVDTEAVSDDDSKLAKEWVERYSLDALLTTDGDGDRPLIADETGTWWRGDVLGLVCAKELGIETLAVPVSCNTAIEKSGFFSRVTRTKIGSPYVIEAMESLSTEFDEVAGFEANGGFLLGTDLTREGRTLSALPTRDALLPALTAMVAAAKQGLPLSAMLEGLPERYTASDRLKEFPTELSKRLIGEWSDRPQSLVAFLKLDSDIEFLDVTDGLRVTLSSGDIIHLRPSGNAPELRCYAESDRYSKAESLVFSTLNKIAEAR